MIDDRDLEGRALEGRDLDQRRRARDDFRRREWSDAHRRFGAALDSLDGEERILHAMTAYLLGRDGDCVDHLEDAYRVLLERGDVRWAARCAFWLAFMLLDGGQLGQGSGWVARGSGLIEHNGLEGVERGYLQVPVAAQTLFGGDGTAAEPMFGEVIAVGLRFDEPDLLALGRLGTGQALVLQGRVRDAMPHLDEAMVAVTSDEVSPVVAGIVYCAVIEACQETFELRRAQEWTAALTRWCDAQPDLVPYRGQCQVHRVEILRLHGSWRAAMTEAGQAREQLSRAPGRPAVGAAIYQEAELHRLQGHLQRAEEAYAEASSYGHEPQPGLARLRLAQGDVAAAAAGLRRALQEAVVDAVRPRLLGAHVEVALAAGDVAGAEAAAAELATIADRDEVPLLVAVSSHATAAVRLAGGDASAALHAGRRAWTIWNDFGAPYEAARARVLVGRACQGLGDHDAARLEIDAARRAFRRLGARVDLAELDAVLGARPPAPGGLTPREVEVLRLVATGRTNRAVAGEIHVSDKTVARHLSNIFTKLGVSSRAAATAWAYDHDLV